MRELKFRAWVATDIEGDGNYEYMEPDASTFTDGFNLHNSGLIVMMQSTGERDKNDVEIYEGDVFHLGDPNITHTVIWVDTGLKGKQNRSSSYVGISHWADAIEVIGNVYETAEFNKYR